MNRSSLYVLTIALVVAVSGCGAILPNVLSDADTNSTRHDQFEHEHEGDNLARRVQGLPELDPCSERYWSDRGWAMQDDACQKRIVRWENGDSTAMNPRGMVLATTVPVVPDSVVKYYRKLDKKRPWGRRVYR